MHFLLYKENISTMDAVNLMMKKLHLKHSKCFQYAGNKDKRAVTVQAGRVVKRDVLFPMTTLIKMHSFRFAC